MRNSRISSRLTSRFCSAKSVRVAEMRDCMLADTWRIRGIYGTVPDMSGRQYQPRHARQISTRSHAVSFFASPRSLRLQHSGRLSCVLDHLPCSRSRMAGHWLACTAEAVAQSLVELSRLFCFTQLGHCALICPPKSSFTTLRRSYLAHFVSAGLPS